MVSRKFSVMILVLISICIPASLIFLWIYKILPYEAILGIVSFLMLGVIVFAIKYTLPLKGQSSSLYELMALSCEDGNYEGAIEFFSKEVKRSKGNTKALFNLGSAYLSKGDFNRSIEIFSKLQKLMPSDSAVLYNLARAYRLGGKFDDAINIFTHILDGGIPSNFPMRDFEYWTEFAVLHVKKGDLNKAFECVDKALELRPNFRDALEIRNEIESKLIREP